MSARTSRPRGSVGSAVAVRDEGKEEGTVVQCDSATRHQIAELFEHRNRKPGTDFSIGLQ